MKGSIQELRVQLRSPREFRHRLIAYRQAASRWELPVGGNLRRIYFFSLFNGLLGQYWLFKICLLYLITKNKRMKRIISSLSKIKVSSVQESGANEFSSYGPPNMN